MTADLLAVVVIGLWLAACVAICARHDAKRFSPSSPPRRRVEHGDPRPAVPPQRAARPGTTTENRTGRRDATRRPMTNN